jgi:hypothetical protein
MGLFFTREGRVGNGVASGLVIIGTEVMRFENGGGENCRFPFCSLDILNKKKRKQNNS